MIVIDGDARDYIALRDDPSGAAMARRRQMLEKIKYPLSISKVHPLTS
jgi:hypothetical protein